MADATVTARVQPEGVDQDIDALATALDGASQALDTVVVDRGQDNHVSVDITHSEAADADGTAGITAIEDAIAEVGDCVLVGDIDVVADPTLNAPGDVTLDISEGDSFVRTYTPTVFGPDARVASVEVTTNEIPSGAVAISRGAPQGHDSQKSPDGSFDLTIGPAVSGDEVGSPHDVIVTVTDSNGRTATDTIVVTVQA